MDGTPVKADFQPLEHPINGKAGEQFAVYLVGVQLDKPEKSWGTDFTLELTNTAFTEPPMFHSAFAKASEPWTVAANSARDVLGDAVDIEDASEIPEAWKQDEALRTLTIGLKKGG